MLLFEYFINVLLLSLSIIYAYKGHITNLFIRNVNKDFPNIDKCHYFYETFGLLGNYFLAEKGSAKMFFQHLFYIILNVFFYY